MTMPKDKKTVQFVDLKRGVNEQIEDLQNQVTPLLDLSNSVNVAEPEAVRLAEEVLALVYAHPSVAFSDFVYDAPANEVPAGAVTLPSNDDDDD
jgi:hypothetical protein